MTIMFLCTGNSCRSILTEATFNHLTSEGWHAMSAGNQPTGQVHPRSLALLERESLPIEGYPANPGTACRKPQMWPSSMPIASCVRGSNPCWHHRTTCVEAPASRIAVLPTPNFALERDAPKAARPLRLAVRL